MRSKVFIHGMNVAMKMAKGTMKSTSKIVKGGVLVGVGLGAAAIGGLMYGRQQKRTRPDLQINPSPFAKKRRLY